MRGRLHFWHQRFALFRNFLSSSFGNQCAYVCPILGNQTLSPGTLDKWDKEFDGWESMLREQQRYQVVEVLEMASNLQMHLPQTLCGLFKLLLIVFPFLSQFSQNKNLGCYWVSPFIISVLLSWLHSFSVSLCKW